MSRQPSLCGDGGSVVAGDGGGGGVGGGGGGGGGDGVPDLLPRMGRA